LLKALSIQSYVDLYGVVVTDLWDQQDKLYTKRLLIKSASSVGVGDVVVITNQMKMTFQLVCGNVSLGVLVKSMSIPTRIDDSNGRSSDER
jgi:hypothetical protein